MLRQKPFLTEKAHTSNYKQGFVKRQMGAEINNNKSLWKQVPEIFGHGKIHSIPSTFIYTG